MALSQNGCGSFCKFDQLKKKLCLCRYSEIEFEFELLKLSCPPALAVSAWGGCSRVSQPNLSGCLLKQYDPNIQKWC